MLKRFLLGWNHAQALAAIISVWQHAIPVAIAVND
jgi:hypothetical protein